jgi:hypothetical protein
MEYDAQPPKSMGRQLEVVHDNFRDGYISLLDEGNMPPTALRETLNVMLVQRNKLKPRPGSKEYGVTLTTPVTGGGEFTRSESGTEVRYIWVIDNGSLKYSADGGSWTSVTGRTWSTSVWTDGYQDRTRLYLTNTTDGLAFLDLDTLTLSTYDSITTPNAPSLALTGITASGTNYVYYRVSAVNSVGETAAGTAGTSNVSKTRDYWTTGTDYITLTITRVTGADRYNIYYADASGYEVYLDSVADPGTGATVTYRDGGEMAANDYISAPIDNTTSGPKLKSLVMSQNRLWGIASDGAVWWSGTGTQSGSFSPFYGGGYIYLQKGGKQTPQVVVHFRDGRGNPLPTILTSTPDGQGSTWHINLTTATIGTTTLLIPEAYQSDSSIGTNSPRGAVTINNSVHYPSRIGWQVLGSRPNLLNVLASREVSTNIRDDVDNLIQDSLSGVTGIYWRGKILWSVPYGSTENNEIWVLDLERNSWILRWSIGVKHFFMYTDSSNVTHLMAIPTTGTKLIEFSTAINTRDSGTPFETRIRSGLNFWDSTHTTWAKPKKAYVEVARPRGSMSFTLYGTKKNREFTSLKSISITDTISAAGLGTFMMGEPLMGDISLYPDTFSQASVKKRLKIGKRLNNYSWQFGSTSGDVDYTLMQVVIKDGYVVKTGDPSSWKN